MYTFHRFLNMVSLHRGRTAVCKDIKCITMSFLIPNNTLRGGKKTLLTFMPNHTI